MGGKPSAPLSSARVRPPESDWTRTYSPGLAAHHLLLYRRVVDRVAVHRRVVEGLHRVLDIALPVGADDMVLAPDGRHVVEPVRAQVIAEVAEMIRQRAAAGIEIDEDEALPAFQPDLGQPVLRGVEIARPLHPVGEGESAVEAIGPAVIGADDALAAPLSVEQLRAAVPAGIGEGAEPPPAVAQHEIFRTGEAHGRVAAGLGPVIGAADQVPLAEENALDLAAVERLRGIAAGRQGFGLGERPPHRLEIRALHRPPSATAAG